MRTRKTCPLAPSEPSRPTRPWIPALIVLGGGSALWVYVGLVLVLAARNDILIPVWILLGSATVPAAALTFAISYTSRREAAFAVRQLPAAAAVGGLGAIIIGGSLDSVDLHFAGLLGAKIFAGLAEESAKLVIVVGIARLQHVSGIRAGLLLGTAVGFGFEISENLGYALAPFLGSPINGGEVIASLGDQATRALSGLISHPIWTGIAAAAALNRSPRRRIPRVIHVGGALLGVSLVHTIWDVATPLAALLPHVSGATQAALGALITGSASAAALLVWVTVVRAAGVTALNGDPRGAARGADAAEEAPH